jgi:hypothetical protein
VKCLKKCGISPIFHLYQRALKTHVKYGSILVINGLQMNYKVGMNFGLLINNCIAN